MPMKTKSAKKPKRAARKPAAHKTTSRKTTTKKKSAARKAATGKKAAPKKKSAAKTKVSAKKKAVAQKKAAPKPKRKVTPKAKIRATAKVQRVPAVAAVAPAPEKRSKSRLIKAGAPPAGGQITGTRAATPEIETATHLQVGQMAPNFHLPANDGRTISLSDFHGQKVVLYFYPKDDTPGCTKEACSFRDGLAAIMQRNAVVLGISADPIDSHEAFHAKYDLNFPLLSDESKETVEAYGVWTEKSFQGRTWMGIERTTFIINEDGRIVRIFPKVQVDGHFDEVFAAL